MASLTEAALGLIDMGARMERMAWRAKVLASAKGLPDKFIAGIGWRQAGPGHWQLFNTWMGENHHTGEKDVPLALFFEEGTVDHLILPVYAKALSWELPGGRRAYSRGHLVSGLPASEAMRGALLDIMEEVKAYMAGGLEADLQKLSEAGKAG